MSEQPELFSDGGTAPRIDRPILEDIRDRLQTASQFSSVTLDTSEGQTHLEAEIDPALNPPTLERRFLDIRWYTNGDFRIHYQEEWTDETWRLRWDRHPNDHNTRDHFHPPPDAATPGEDRSWATEYRDVMSRLLSLLARRNDDLWDEVERAE